MMENHLSCFGTATTQDACMQCPDNAECAKETIKRWKKGGGFMVKKVKIFCHCCDGKGTITEKEYPSGKEIEVLCPECNGEKWVWSEK